MHTGVRDDLDVRALGDTVDQVLRHLVTQGLLATNEDLHPALGIVREVHSRLTGGIRTADDDHRASTEQQRVRGRSAVEDAVVVKAIDTLRFELLVGEPGRQDDRLREILAPFTGLHELHGPFAHERDGAHPLRATDFRTQVFGLQHTPFRELLAGDTVGKPGVVVDAGTTARLTTQFRVMYTLFLLP